MLIWRKNEEEGTVQGEEEKKEWGGKGEGWIDEEEEKKEDK